jgi:hypothetical protein
VATKSPIIANPTLLHRQHESLYRHLQFPRRSTRPTRRWGYWIDYRRACRRRFPSHYGLGSRRYSKWQTLFVDVNFSYRPRLIIVNILFIFIVFFLSLKIGMASCNTFTSMLALLIFVWRRRTQIYIDQSL